jgi:hypothetical protein
MQKSNGSDPEQRPTQYDVIELRAAVDGREAGARGTIVAEGMHKGLVDFAWGEGARDVEVQEPDLEPIPYAFMRIVARRPDLRAVE